LKEIQRTRKKSPEGSLLLTIALALLVAIVALALLTFSASKKAKVDGNLINIETTDAALTKTPD
jgi:hypothetical protein